MKISELIATDMKKMLISVPIPIGGSLTRLLITYEYAHVIKGDKDLLVHIIAISNYIVAT